MSTDDPWASAHNALSMRSRVIALANDWDEIVRAIGALARHDDSGVGWQSRDASYAEANADALFAEARSIRDQLWDLTS
jgi:hypothetical protein